MKKIFAYIAFSLLILINISWAKDLYLTVRRDFSPQENPLVELLYRSRTPITIRVLKPTNMKEFIGQQVDLRRSWKNPKVAINPAKYLIRGVNKTYLDLDWPRMAANGELRKEIMAKQSAIFKGGKIREIDSLLVEGPPKIIYQPDQFDLVKEVVIFPDSEDKNSSFDVPGFNWWFHDDGDSSFKTKFIPLPPLPSGFYVLQVVQGMLEGQVVVVSNDLMSYMQQSEDKVLVRVANRDGKMVRHATISVRNLNGDWVADASTNENGEALIQNVDDKELIIVVEKEGLGTAIIDSEFFSTTAIYPDLYLYTDRPMYKPGNQLNFKGILRHQQDGISKILGKKEKVLASVIDLSNNQVVEKRELEVNDFGTFSGNFDLPENNIQSGVYRLEAEVLEGKHIGEFRIKDYVKPIFWAKILGAQETLHAGDTLNAEITTGRYSGGIPAGVEYKVELYRVRFSLPQFVEDAGMSETGSNQQYGFDNSEQVTTTLPLLVQSQEFKPLDPNGKTKLKLSIPEKLPGAPNYDYSFNLKITLKDKDSNYASVSKMYMDLRSEHMIQAKVSAVYSSSKNPGKLMIRAVYPSGKSYGKCSGSIKWLLQEYGKDYEVVLETPVTTDEMGNFQQNIPTEKVGRLRAEIVIQDRKGIENKAAVESLVVGDGDIEKVAQVDEIQVFARKSVFNVGETAKTLILLPEGWGLEGNNQGKLFVTVAGRDFYDHTVLNVKGLLAWVNQEMLDRFGTAVYLIISYPHPKKGWIETQVNYRIIQDEKIIKIGISPEDKIVQPGAEQTIKFNVSDKKGRGVKAELAIAVVDEAVLALQPEFRPTLMDFFYPTDRLNMMSFYSTQFQSYGYGEYLAKQFRPNVYLATNKDRDALKEKDTAYWNGHVVTDDAGKAEVKFSMPANRTTWKVIASAVDRDGRFGEQVNDFKSSMYIEAILAMPYFLRMGDTTHARLILSNIKPNSVAPIKIGYHLTSSSGVNLGPEKDGETLLKFKEEHYQKIEVKTDLSSEGMNKNIIDLILDYDQKRLKFPQELLLRSGYDSLPVEAAWKDNQLSFKLENFEKVNDVEITLMQGLSGVLGTSLQWLFTYPYGCVEQLVNTTIPNLAIAQTYKALKEMFMKSKNKAKSLKDFVPSSWFDRVIKNFRVAQFFIKYEVIPPADGIKVSKEFDAVLEKAHRFSESGLSKLQANMMPNGSFAWFPDSDHGDISMTLHVLLSVSMVQNYDLISSIEVKKIYKYLRDILGNGGLDIENVLLNFIASRLYTWGQAIDGPQEFITQIKLQGEHVLGKGSIIEMAYVLMTIKNFNYSNEGGMDRIRLALEEKLYQSVTDIVDKKKEFNSKTWLPVANSRFYRHLGRDASAVAIAANALAMSGRSDNTFASMVGNYLMTKFNGNHFGSTYETSHIILNSLWIFEQQAKDFQEKFPFDFILSGKSIKREQIKISYFPLGWSVMLDSKLFMPGDNRIEIKGSDDQTIKTATVVKQVPFDKITAAKKNWSIMKKYFLVDEKTGEKTLLNLDKDRIQVGDLVYTQLDFNAEWDKMPWWKTKYVILYDDIPAGLSVIDEDRSYEVPPYSLEIQTTKYASRSINAHRVNWFFNLDDSDKNRVGYMARANFAGQFQTGIAKVNDFYDEQNFAYTESYRLGIDSLP